MSIPNTLLLINVMMCLIHQLILQLCLCQEGENEGAFSGGKMSNGYDFAFAIGGAAGQGIATPGNILARIFVRRGLHLYAYNAYQSINTSVGWSGS